MNSKLIVIDGLDGSGKSTQLDLCKEKLAKMGLKVKVISFPDYKSDSSVLVRMYLNGDFSHDPNDINAYAASSFYAVDRYASYMTNWKRDYEEGSIILAARYVSSNALHQMSKLAREEWDEYLDWLYDYEYEKLGLPKADKVIFLDMPIEISQKLLLQRYEGNNDKKDIHESHVDYLYKCRDSALYAAEKLGWSIVSCNEDDMPLPQELISNKILKIINDIINH